MLQFSKCLNVVHGWWKWCLSIKRLGSGWDAELFGVSTRFKLFAYGTTVVLGGLRVKTEHLTQQYTVHVHLNTYAFKLILMLKNALVCICSYIIWTEGYFKTRPTKSFWMNSVQRFGSRLGAELQCIWQNVYFKLLS